MLSPALDTFDTDVSELLRSNSIETSEACEFDEICAYVILVWAGGVFPMLGIVAEDAKNALDDIVEFGTDVSPIPTLCMEKEGCQKVWKTVEIMFSQTGVP